MHQPSSYVLPGLFAFFLLCCVWLDMNYDMEVMSGEIDSKAQGRHGVGHPFMGKSVSPGKWKQVDVASPIARGDIVLFRSPLGRDSLLVSRVIAMAGEQVAIKADVFHVEDAPLADGYGIGQVSGEMMAYRVPRECFFLLNDLRPVVAGLLQDSRYLGPIHRSLILGIVSPEEAE